MSSVTERINAERLVVLAWSRAILLQVAHPLVALGVADHSSFRTGRLSAFRRLHDTVRAMRAIAFGDDATRQRTIEGIRRIHDRVHGTLPASAGSYAAGTPYSAHNPDLLLWVHVTLIESIVLFYDRTVEPLPEGARDEYCQSAAPVALALGARAGDMPMSWSALTAVLDAEYASGRVVVTDTARRVGRDVLRPPMAWLAWPATSINRLVTIGSLPPAIRDAYGFEWTPRHERRCERALRVVRRLRRMTPDRLAVWPEARRAGGA